jgi:hypothetical protein
MINLLRGSMVKHHSASSKKPSSIEPEVELTYLNLIKFIELKSS